MKVIVCSLLLLFGSIGFAQDDNALIRRVVSAKTPDEFDAEYKKLPEYLRKITGALLFQLPEFAAASGNEDHIRVTSALVRKQNSNLTFDSLGTTHVEIGVQSYEPRHRLPLEKIGVIIQDFAFRDTLSPHYVCYIPFDKIIPAAKLPFVRYIEPIGRPSTNSEVITAGKGQLRVYEATENFYVDGTVVKIGVMSDGVSNYASSLGAGELPSNFAIATKIINGQLTELNRYGGDEGTALGELVHDIAPG